MAHRLDCVGMEQHALLPAEGPDLPNGLDGADLIVDIHDGHQAGVLSDSGLQLLQAHQAVFVDRQIGDLKALLFQLLQRVQYRVVLDGVGNDVLLSLLRAHPGSLGDGPVIGLRAAAGEIDLPGLGAQAFCHRLPGVHQGEVGLPPLLVEGAGVAVQLPQGGKHRLHRRLAYGGSGGVVCVNEHGSHTFFLMPAGIVPAKIYPFPIGK